MCDYYVDIDHGAVKELERELQTRYKTATKETSWIFARIMRVSSRQSGDEKITDSEAERGGCELQTRSGVPRLVDATATFARESGVPGREHLGLLVCLNHETTLKLKQEDLQDIRDDRQLFHHLRKRLSVRQYWVTWRNLKSITLAKVGSEHIQGFTCVNYFSVHGRLQ